MKWGVQRRLEFIDFRLFWEGRINRADLMDWFGISAQQASTDLDRYAERAEGNMEYDRVQKTFVRASGYRPFFIEGMHNRYLMQMQAMKRGWLDPRQSWFDALPPAEIVSLEHAPVDETVLMAVMDAIRHNHELEVEYWPMSDKPASMRRIAPHALAYSDRRWHARCWNLENQDFRDFNLTRMANAAASKPSHVNSAHDLEWHTIATMKIVPNPKLSAFDREAVRREYGIKGEVHEVRTRLALLFYYRQAYKLEEAPREDESPKLRPLILLNRDELEELRLSARRMSVIALQGGAA
ncbi:MAG: WYL domain-containing protein [Pseudomonadota bacterium]|nr:WYL domain-containing protein [Pseudomonadota bacterium]